MKVGRKGDTLVEVALAVGIFSLVAIAVAAVLSGSTSGAQTALETTVAREEIDTQAEALRYIQTAYAVNHFDSTDTNKEKNKYYALWKKITENAVDLKNTAGYTEDDYEELLNYTPTSCNELYNDDSNSFYKYAFIINPRMLGTFNIDALDSVYISSGTNKLSSAILYPRLIYSATDKMVEDGIPNTLSSAEGIYVVAVKDKNTTKVIDISGDETEVAGFYDFYIRSCWYGIDSEVPSTISTVIRLYDPDILASQKMLHMEFDDCPWGEEICQYRHGRKLSFPTPPESDTHKGWILFWVDKSNSSKSYPAGSSIVADQDDPAATQTARYRPDWRQIKYHIKYDVNYPYTVSNPVTINDTICHEGTEAYNSSTGRWGPFNENCYLTTERPRASGYLMAGWCTVEVTPEEDCEAAGGKKYDRGAFFANSATFPSDEFTGNPATDIDRYYQHTLYGIWKEHNETITILAEWTSDTDYDSYMKLQSTSSNGYIDANYNTTNKNVTYGGETYSLVTGHGDGRGYDPRYSEPPYTNKYEKFTINTLGGKNYYYSIRKFTGYGDVGDDVTVTVSGPYLGTKVFYSKDLGCTGNYWNVFAYKDGDIVERKTCTAYPDPGIMEYDY